MPAGLTDGRRESPPEPALGQSLPIKLFFGPMASALPAFHYPIS